MSHNWEEFEENLQELKEQLELSSSSKEEALDEFTSSVDKQTEDMSEDERETALSIAGRYGYQHDRAESGHSEDLDD